MLVAAVLLLHQDTLMALVAMVVVAQEHQVVLQIAEQIILAAVVAGISTHLFQLLVLVALASSFSNHTQPQKILYKHSHHLDHSQFHQV